MDSRRGCVPVRIHVDLTKQSRLCMRVINSRIFTFSYRYNESYSINTKHYTLSVFRVLSPESSVTRVDLSAVYNLGQY
jgi:hypothetical protein